MATSISHSPEETQALGDAWGRAAKSGLVIGVSGDLGAGKTQLAKGVARGLGITSRIQSPTFALVNLYDTGRLPFFHVDLYRLETPGQILAAGLEQYFQPAGVSVIEWAERWLGDSDLAKIKNQTPGIVYRRVFIEVVNETERRIIHEDFGA